jgi:predicted dehydrogenase
MPDLPRSLDIAIVGAGYIGDRHARVIAQMPDARVAAVVDTVRGRADAIADKVVQLGGTRPTVHSSVDEAIAAGGINVAVIGVPSGRHADIAERTVAAGIHTLVEKPIDVSPEAARRIAAVAAAHPETTVSIVSQHRFDPASRLVHDAIAAGRFGTITSGLAVLPWWRTQEYYDSGDWRGTWALDGGGSLMNQGVHNLDLLVWFLGEPVEVFAHTALLAHEGVEVEDTAVATLTFASGALATMLATTAAYPGLTPRIYINGSSGSAMIDNDRLSYFYAASSDETVDRYGSNATSNQADDVRGGPEETYPSFEDELEAGHRRQWDDFADAVRTGRAPSVTVDDATTALWVIRAIYESARGGKPVLVADVKAGHYSVDAFPPGPLVA